MSPDQKREVVEFIRNGIPEARTLAVGDGANDVSMIKAAHIGVRELFQSVIIIVKLKFRLVLKAKKVYKL
jgi:P-type E1-E2 ATPase